MSSIEQIPPLSHEASTGYEEILNELSEHIPPEGKIGGYTYRYGVDVDNYEDCENKKESKEDYLELIEARAKEILKVQPIMLLDELVNQLAIDYEIEAFANHFIPIYDGSLTLVKRKEVDMEFKNAIRGVLREFLEFGKFGMCYMKDNKKFADLFYFCVEEINEYLYEKDKLADFKKFLVNLYIKLRLKAMNNDEILEKIDNSSSLYDEEFKLCFILAFNFVPKSKGFPELYINPRGGEDGKKYQVII